MRYVLPYPVFKSTWLLRRPCAKLPAPLDRPGTLFFAFSRAALAAGLRLLGLKPGDNVLLPSFICNVVMAPFNELSIEPRFYDLDEQLAPDLSTAEVLLDDRTRALVTVNYFGFAPDFAAIRGFCDRHGLYFIEDNAHGFLSCKGDRPLGRFGDIAIVSFRKTLGLLDGAALVVNNPALESARPVVDDAEPAMSAGRNLARSVMASIRDSTGIDVPAPMWQAYHAMLDGVPGAGIEGGPPGEEVSLRGYRRRLSGLSRAVLWRVNSAEIAARHRDGFHAWTRWLASAGSIGAEPLFAELPSGVVPMAFPLVGRSYDRIEALLKELNIRWDNWPGLLPHFSPGWRFFDRVLLLPVHCPEMLPSKA